MTHLKRELGPPGAVLMGLGAMLGTGVFVSIGFGAGIAGPAVVLALLLAAGLATCNAFSSAQLAASHPVSGGTYEYGYRYLRPWLGFSAGWMFLCAKTASAATAALGFAAYLLQLLGFGEGVHALVAGGAAISITLLVLGGIRRSNVANVAIVSVTLAALVAFIVAGLPPVVASGTDRFVPLFGGADGGTSAPAFFHATALMFVAFTGYARIATLGEEVRAPRRTIPRAIAWTLAVSAIVYVGVAIVGIGLLGADGFGRAAVGEAVPLVVAARMVAAGWLAPLVAVGAATAMLGVLLNLVLGLSRVALAMGRQGDLPPRFARVDAQRSTPSAAVVGVGIAVTALALTASIETSWTFSAFTVLLYYAITNLAALQLPDEDRLYPRTVAIIGLAGCLFLAWWVPVGIWMAGLALLGLGLLWHVVVARRWRQASTTTGRTG